VHCSMKSIVPKFHWGIAMSAFERFLEPGCTEGPPCRCGKEMKVASIERLPEGTDDRPKVSVPRPTLSGASHGCTSCNGRPERIKLTLGKSATAL
jgi:hypothetical protein